MTLEKSKSGDFTAKISNRYLHSKYNPIKEAIKFIDQWMSDSGNSTKRVIVLIEPGLGYLIRILKSRYPSKILLPIFASKETYDYCKEIDLFTGCFPSFYSAEYNFTSILSAAAINISIKDIGIMSWSAAELIFNDEFIKIKENILSSLRILQGNEQTRNHFARRWFENGIRNYLRFDFSGTLSFSPSPIILVSSGPSLEKSIESIKSNQNQYIIAALPSSLAILNAYDIVPDILFSTDPGYYAKEHLKYLHEKTICIAPITSSLMLNENLLAGFSQNGFIERCLYKGSELPIIPEMGTVAATALTYLRKMTDQTIYITGLDFCIDDLKIHAQPHTFNPLILKNESRFSTGNSLFFDRISNMTYRQEGQYKFSRSMDTYAAWFKGQKFDNRILRVLPSVVDLPIPSVNKIPNNIGQEKSIYFSLSDRYPLKDERQERITKLVDRLQKGLVELKTNNRFSAFFKEFTAELEPKLLTLDSPVMSDIDQKNRLNKLTEIIEKIGYLI